MGINVLGIGIKNKHPGIYQCNYHSIYLYYYYQYLYCYYEGLGIIVNGSFLFLITVYGELLLHILYGKLCYGNHVGISIFCMYNYASFMYGKINTLYVLSCIICMYDCMICIIVHLIGCVYRSGYVCMIVRGRCRNDMHTVYGNQWVLYRERELYPSPIWCPPPALFPLLWEIGYCVWEAG